MKLKNFKMRYIVLPSVAFLLAIWFIPTGMQRTAPVSYEYVMPESVEGEEPTFTEEPMMFDGQFQTEKMSWQKWATWGIAFINGFMGILIQIKKFKNA